MLHTPLQSPIARLVGAPSSHARRPQSAASSTSSSARVAATATGNFANAHARPHTAAAAATSATHHPDRSDSSANSHHAPNHRQHQQPNASSATAYNHNNGHSGRGSALLQVDDCGVSARLMQCLDALHREPPVVLNVETRFRRSLRPIDQATRDRDWRRRMESSKILREDRQAEVHRRTQMHQLFKHYAFEQRMNSRTATPSATGVTAAAVTYDAAAAAGAGAGGNMVLFATTANSLTRADVEEYFAVPSFVRPLLTTIQHQRVDADHRTASAMSSSSAAAAAAPPHGRGSASLAAVRGRSGSVQHLQQQPDPASAFAQTVAERVDATQAAALLAGSAESFRRAQAAAAASTQRTGAARPFK